MSIADVSDIESVFREEYGRAVAILTRIFGDIDTAEDAVQDAFTAAVQKWPAAGVPASPIGWIVTTARHRATDRVRREASRDARQAEAVMLYGNDDSLQETSMRNDELRLIFTCCHPALAVNAQVALTLRLLGGLTTAEVARGFLVPEVTMAQRLVRAKAKIKAAKIPYRIPDDSELPARVHAVLAVVYLIFNEGYTASSGDRLMREDLCAQAIRLGTELTRLLPNDFEVQGLLALMLLAESRRLTRTTPDGDVVLLADQDRRLWNQDLISSGQTIVRRCLEHNQPGPYQIQAAINAVHCDAATAEGTDWRQILMLYDQLYALRPTPVVALNRAVALAEVEGPTSALLAIEGLPLDNYAIFYAIKADLLRRNGDVTGAARAYQAAITRTENGTELKLLHRRLASLAGSAAS